MAGRQPEFAPDGYMTPREVGARLGITASAVRERIRRGTMPVGGKDIVSQGGEGRYYVPASWVEEELKRREEVPTREDMQLHDDAMVERLGELAGILRESFADALSESDKRIVEAINLQRQDIIAELKRGGKLRSRQFETILARATSLEAELAASHKEAEEARREAREARAQEKEYREEALRLMQAALAQQRYPEGRTFWEWLFGR